MGHPTAVGRLHSPPPLAEKLYRSLMAFQSFAVLSALVAAVLAQSQNPFIPAGISSACTNYLTSLNTDASLAPCMEFLTATLSAFGPGTGSTPPSIPSTLDKLCGPSASSQCPQSTITAQLSAFYAACTPELTSSRNSEVQISYDSLYAVRPFREAVCSKDDSGSYCATKLSNSSSATSAPLFTTTTPPGSNLTYYAPNPSTYQSANILFLFLQTSTPPSQLCTTCTRGIITSYISWESNVPYGPGLTQSLLLSGQRALYNYTNSQCGASFLSGAVQAAGGLSGSIVSAASRVSGYDLFTAVSTILGAVALVVASL